MEPPIDPVRRTGVGLPLLGLTAGMAIAVALYAVMTAPGGVMGVWSALTLPSELRNAAFVSVENSALGPVYTVRGFSFAAAEQGMKLASLVVEDGREVAVRFTSTRYALQVNGNTIISKDAFIDTPARAPKGLAYAYARPHGTSTVQELKQLSPVGVVLAPGAWESVVYYPLIERETVLGRGYAPLFVTDTVILLITPGGIERLDMDRGTVERVLDRPFPLVVDHIKQSPDRTLIAFTDPADQVTYIYRVGASALEEVLRVERATPSYALGNDALYVVRKLQSGTEVWRHGLSGEQPRLIYTFPAFLAIGQIAL